MDISTSGQSLRRCLRSPILEITEAANLLNEAVTAHLAGRPAVAEELIRRVDLPVLREWTESLWGTKSPYVKPRVISNTAPHLQKDQRVPLRMPNVAEKRLLHERDGYHCRFCGIPVIRMEIRKRIQQAYPDALSWGATNPTQHAAFQLMWLQYDHVLPHARGGNNDLDNIVITCAPCNYARMKWTLEEVGLVDPRTQTPTRSDWDGLERFR